jgi:predicted DNA-binding transcriptional regulator YafY
VSVRAVNRRLDIAQMCGDRPSWHPSVAELAAQFGVTARVIRHDVSELLATGYIDARRVQL